MNESIAERREKASLYKKARGALEASGLPVVASGYTLRFPNSPILFRFDSTFTSVDLYTRDLDKDRVSSADKNILAIALLLGIDNKTPTTRAYNGF